MAALNNTIFYAELVGERRFEYMVGLTFAFAVMTAKAIDHLANSSVRTAAVHLMVKTIIPSFFSLQDQQLSRGIINKKRSSHRALGFFQG